MDIVYSIIIPHRNMPALLQRCLDSVPRRPDVEVIVVDDDSNEASLHVLADMARHEADSGNDGWQFVVGQSQGGAGAARNVGLRLARGRKVLFADADDYFNYCIRDVLDDYRDDDSDIVFFDVLSVDSERYTHADRATYLNRYIAAAATNWEYAQFHLRYSFGEPWCKLIKKELIDREELSFSEVPVHNDTRFSYMAGHYADTVKTDRRALYCVTSRQGSISDFHHIDENYLTTVRLFAEREQFLRAHGVDADKVRFRMHYVEMYRRRNDKTLFEAGMKVLEEYGFSREHVEKRISIERRKERKKKRREWLAHHLSFVTMSSSQR